MNQEIPPPAGPGTPRSTLRAQRDQMLAGALLAVCLAVALGLSNFGHPYEALQQARTAVQLHRELLAQNEKVLQANRQVLGQDRALLARMKRAAGVNQR